MSELFSKVYISHTSNTFSYPLIFITESISVICNSGFLSFLFVMIILSYFLLQVYSLFIFYSSVTIRKHRHMNSKSIQQRFQKVHILSGYCHSLYFTVPAIHSLPCGIQFISPYFYITFLPHMYFLYDTPRFGN